MPDSFVGKVVVSYDVEGVLYGRNFKNSRAGRRGFPCGTESEVRVGIFLVEPALTLGAAAGATELSVEPFLESFGAGVADEVDDGVAEAAVLGVAKFCGGAGPERPFGEWCRRVSGRGGADDDGWRVAVGSWAVASREKDGVHQQAPTRNLVS